MRFDSFRALITFLKALGDLGYQVPFNDYENDFKNHGFNMHIHFYKFNLIILDDCIILSTSDNYGNYYSIRCDKTKYTIRKQLKVLLKDYINYKTSINTVNACDNLIKLLNKEDNDNA